jgi:hypothetical protein
MYVRFFKNMMGLPICAAHRLAELKVGIESRKKNVYGNGSKILGTDCVHGY